MPTIAIPAPPFADPPANVPGLRTLGTGAQQACAGNDPRLAGGASATLQAAYTAGAPGQQIIVLSSVNGGFRILDNSPTIGGRLFDVADNTGGVHYFTVTTSPGAASIRITTPSPNTATGIIQNTVNDYTAGAGGTPYVWQNQGATIATIATPNGNNTQISLTPAGTGTVSATLSGVDFIGTSQTAGLALVTNAAAAAGAGNQQWSPGIQLTGNQWDGSSVPTNWMVQVRTNNLGGQAGDLRFTSRYNGGSWVQQVALVPNPSFVTFDFGTRDAAFLANANLYYQIGGSTKAQLNTTGFQPFADKGLTIGAAGNRFSAGFLGTDSVGTAQTVSLTLQNTTAAANNAQQYSPVLELIGQGWQTTTPASETSKIGIQMRPVQASTHASMDLVYFTSQAGGAYAEQYAAKFVPGTGVTLAAQKTLTLQANVVQAAANTTAMTTIANVAAGASSIAHQHTTTTELGANNEIVEQWTSGSNIFMGIQRVGSGTGNSTGTWIWGSGAAGALGVSSGLRLSDGQGTILKYSNQSVEVNTDVVGISFHVGGANVVQIQASALQPATTLTGYSIGDSSHVWKAAFAQHFVSGGTAPSISLTANGAWGTSPTLTLSGTDASGVITFTTGTGPLAMATYAGTASQLGVVTFNAAYGVAPVVVLTPCNGDAAAQQSAPGFTFFVDSASTTTTQFVIFGLQHSGANQTLPASTALKFAYTVIG